MRGCWIHRVLTSNEMTQQTIDYDECWCWCCHDGADDGWHDGWDVLLHRWKKNCRLASTADMMILMMAAFKEEWRLTRWHAHGPYQSVQVTSFSCSSACIQVPLTAMLSGPYQAVNISHWCIDDALVVISVLLYIYIWWWIWWIWWS